MSRYTVVNKDYNLSKYHKRRQELIILLGGKCVRCGSTENLEFDHIDPNTKEYGISAILIHSWKKVLKEIKKCQLLCHACHLIKNKIDNGEARHGSLSMYRHHRCRCDACVNIWNKKCREYSRKYKLKLKMAHSSIG